MKKKELYTCEICGTDYADKANAMACEKAHKKVNTAKITGKFKPIAMHPSGVPYKLEVVFADGTAAVYKL